MDWLVVRFPYVRDVFVDGQRVGVTNTRLAVGSGGHTIHLGVPVAYLPRVWQGVIAHTTMANPAVVTFQPAAAGAALRV